MQGGAIPNPFTPNPGSQRTGKGYTFYEQSTCNGTAQGTGQPPWRGEKVTVVNLTCDAQ